MKTRLQNAGIESLTLETSYLNDESQRFKALLIGENANSGEVQDAIGELRALRMQVHALESRIRK